MNVASSGYHSLLAAWNAVCVNGGIFCLAYLI